MILTDSTSPHTPAPTERTKSEQPKRQWRDRTILWGLIALFLFGLAGLISATSWEDTWSELRKLTALQVVALLALSLINYLMRGVRWHFLSARLGIGLPLGQSIMHFIGGFAMTITPARVGELVRLRWIKRLTGWSISRSAPLPLADRAFDLAAMGIVLGGAILISGQGGFGAAPVAIAAIGGAIVVTRPSLLMKLVELAYSALHRWPRAFAKLRQAARSMGRFSAPATSLPALGFSVIGWMAEGFALYLLLQWIGADIGLATATLIFVFSTLAGGLTGAPGGLGGAEASMVVLLSMNGIPLHVALVATTVIRITTFWFALLIGALTFPFAEAHSNKSR